MHRCGNQEQLKQTLLALLLIDAHPAVLLEVRVRSSCSDDHALLPKVIMTVSNQPNSISQHNEGVDYGFHNPSNFAVSHVRAAFEVFDVTLAHEILVDAVHLAKFIAFALSDRLLSQNLGIHDSSELIDDCFVWQFIDVALLACTVFLVGV